MQAAGGEDGMDVDAPTQGPAGPAWPLCTLGLTALASALSSLALKEQPDTVHDLVDACATVLKHPQLPGETLRLIHWNASQTTEACWPVR